MTDCRKLESELQREDLPDGYCAECNCFDCEYDCRARIDLHYDYDGRVFTVYCAGFSDEDEEE